MKNTTFILTMAVLGLSACSPGRMAGTESDDVYYSGKDDNKGSESAYFPESEQTAPNNDASMQQNQGTEQNQIVPQEANPNQQDQAYQNNNGEQNANPDDAPNYRTQDQYTDENGNTYITNNYYNDDNYDYTYTSRIRRFYYPYGWSYYDPYYTNMYWYDYNPYSYGVSLYLSYSWWVAPYAGLTIGFGSPYYGYPGYGGGFGYYNPYYGGWNPYGGYYGAHNAYWNGYYDGLYAGTFNPYYCNTYDPYSYYYGPRPRSGYSGNVPRNGFNAPISDLYGRSVLSESGREFTADATIEQNAIGRPKRGSVNALNTAPVNVRSNTSKQDQFIHQSGVRNVTTPKTNDPKGYNSPGNASGNPKNPAGSTTSPGKNPKSATGTTAPNPKGGTKGNTEAAPAVKNDKKGSYGTTKSTPREPAQSTPRQQSPSSTPRQQSPSQNPKGGRGPSSYTSPKKQESVSSTNQYNKPQQQYQAPRQTEPRTKTQGGNAPLNYQNPKQNVRKETSKRTDVSTNGTGRTNVQAYPKTEKSAPSNSIRQQNSRAESKPQRSITPSAPKQSSGSHSGISKGSGRQSGNMNPGR